jgi:excisionase family DNA binding protein
MITIDEAARELRLAPFTIRKYARENLIPATKVGRSWMFDSIDAIRSALAVRGGNKLQHARLRGRIA